jgi:hypothetical protein
LNYQCQNRGGCFHICICNVISHIEVKCGIALFK